ncbi:MAG: phasin family protein [Chloroflexota bacterium]|nr:phasin family protein [Chloroflexota bacterium]
MSVFGIPNRVRVIVVDTTQGLTNSSRRVFYAGQGAVSVTIEETGNLLNRRGDVFESLVERGESLEWFEIDRLKPPVQGWRTFGHQHFDGAEELLEQRLQEMLQTLKLPTADDVERLNHEIDRLSRKLDSYLVAAGKIQLPIEGYPEMTVKEVVPELDGLDRDELLTIREFEQGSANRKTLLEEIDRKLAHLDDAA